MRAIKTTYGNGDTVVTSINGTDDEIKAYFLGQWFNFGVEGDNMQQCVAVDFLD